LYFFGDGGGFALQRTETKVTTNIRLLYLFLHGYFLIQHILLTLSFSKRKSSEIPFYSMEIYIDNFGISVSFKALLSYKLTKNKDFHN